MAYRSDRPYAEAAHRGAPDPSTLHGGPAMRREGADRVSTDRVEAALVALHRACPSVCVVQDPDVLAGMASDESEVPPCLPHALVRVQCTEEVAAVLRAAHDHMVPVTPRGGGTGRVGGAVPILGGIVLAFDGLAAIKEISETDRIAVIEPGVILQQFHEASEAQGLFYPPDPNSLSGCTLGGNLAANAGGPRAFKYGVTQHYALGLTAVTADGTVLRTGKRTKKGVTGYDLTSLLVGSEGTLAVITEATMRLVDLPEEVHTFLVCLPSDASIEAAVVAMQRAKLQPRCLELVDSLALDIMRPAAGLPLPEGTAAMLIIEFDGTAQSLEESMERFAQTMDDVGAVDVLAAKHGGERERLWAARRSLSYALRHAARFKLSEDVVVPLSRLTDLLRVCRGISERFGIRMPAYGHAGDGNLHVNFLWDDPREQDAVHAAVAKLFGEVIAMRGTLSGEHGIGVLKAPFLPLEQSPSLIGVQQGIKALFDPKGILNPGKIFPARSAPVGRGSGACSSSGGC